MPVETGQTVGDSPLAKQVSLPELIVSMNHTIGDGYTYYHLPNVLDPEAALVPLDPGPVDGSETVKVIGEPETAMQRSDWRSRVVFCPREGELAPMIISRGLDSADLLDWKG